MHYRLTLTKGRGPKMKMIAERHSYSKTPPSGWWRSVHLLGSTIHSRECWYLDEKCGHLAAPGGFDPTFKPSKSLAKPGGEPDEGTKEILAT